MRLGRTKWTLANDVLTLRNAMDKLGAERDALLGEVQRLSVERDAMQDTIREASQHLAKVPEYAELGAIPLVLAIEQLVNDHSELEARIEAVLILHRNHVAYSAEVHRLLRGGQRVPDTIEGIQ